MDKQAIRDELKIITDDYLKSQGFDLIDFICRYEGNTLVLRILADKPEGGITIDECARINKEIGIIFEGKDTLKERYILEVVSPGLDRPLSNRKDFSRCIGRRVRFFLNEPINKKWELEGEIKAVEENSLRVAIGEEILNIPLSGIMRAKQAI